MEFTPRKIRKIQGNIDPHTLAVDLPALAVEADAAIGEVDGQVAAVSTSLTGVNGRVETIEEALPGYLLIGDAEQYGIAGPPNALNVGSVVAAEEASATITGDAPSQTLNLQLPRGLRGIPGPGGTLALVETADEGLFTESPVLAWRWDTRVGVRLFFRDEVADLERMVWGTVGWVDVDISNTAGSIRDPANPGALQLRRDGNRVTARLRDVGLAAGSGGGFLLANNLPAGYRAMDITGPATSAELGSSGSVANRHRVHVSTDDIYWCGWSNASGAYSTTRTAGTLIQGEMTWHTDGPWPLPGSSI